MWKKYNIGFERVYEGYDIRNINEEGNAILKFIMIIYY